MKVGLIQQQNSADRAANITKLQQRIRQAAAEGAELVIKPERIARQIELIEEVHRQNPMPIRF